MEGQLLSRSSRHDQLTWILNPPGATTGVALGNYPMQETSAGIASIRLDLRDSRKATMVDEAQREDRRAQG